MTNLKPFRGVDFETRSGCDLIKSGAYKYASDLTTQAICCSTITPEGEVNSWWPLWVSRILDDEALYLPFEDLAEKEGIYKGMYSACNSQFDRLIWQFVCENDYKFPPTKIEQWHCSASLARSNGLPGKLENCARALGLSAQKDQRGKQLIKLLSIPSGGTREQPIFNEDPKLIREMIAYCEQDAIVEAEILNTLRAFLPHELEEFFESERINDRGIELDIPFAKKAVTFSSVEMRVIEEDLSSVTNGEIERPKQYQRVKNWLLRGYRSKEDPDGKGLRYYPGLDSPRIHPDVVKIMTVYKKGQRKLSLDKNIRNQILECYKADPKILTPEALEVIQITDLAGRSSTAKYKKMVDREVDNRLHGAFMFSGAISTGRFSSTGVQIHNLLRDCVDDFDEALKGLETQTDREVIHTLAKMMRPTLKASEGQYLYWSDWSNVEGRGLAYLANDKRADEKLELFAYLDDHPDEPDMYEIMAEKMGLDDRQTGKVAELSLGFGGGVGAFQAMARNYQVRVSDNMAKKIQTLWRSINPWAEPFWYALKDAAWKALSSPNTFFPAGRVKYFYTKETHNGLGTLWCQLPSKRLLAYVDPKFERVPCPWDDDQTMTELTAIKANFKPKQGETEWPRNKLWYGVLAENVTQAFCADLLRATLVTAAQYDLKVVAHTHDEIVVEDEWGVPERLQWVMQQRPDWMDRLFPLAADIKSGKRYTK